MTDNAMLMQTAPYQASYCEENVWHLLGAQLQAEVPAQAVIVSNANATVLYFQQRAAPKGYLCWDYHVFAMSANVVLDLDHRDRLPMSVSEYVAASFPGAADWPEDLRPQFLTLDAGDYRLRFSSDRRHMRRGNSWLAPPPPWPCIGDGHTLGDLLRETREAGSPLEQWP